jgi:sec-independent protein translocase protein TatA
MIDNAQQILAFGMPGGWEWIVILAVALLIFGRKLPEIARNVGKSLTEFKKGINEAKETKDEVVRDVNNLKNDVINEAKKATADDEPGNTD